MYVVMLAYSRYMRSVDDTELRALLGVFYRISLVEPWGLESSGTSECRIQPSVHPRSACACYSRIRLSA